MICNDRDNTVSEILELVVEQGIKLLLAKFDGIAEAIRLLVKFAVEIERDRYLGVLPYEWSDRHQGWKNSYKPKRVKTRLGELELSVPQARREFYPRNLEKGLR